MMQHDKVIWSEPGLDTASVGPIHRRPHEVSPEEVLSDAPRPLTLRVNASTANSPVLTGGSTSVY